MTIDVVRDLLDRRERRIEHIVTAWVGVGLIGVVSIAYCWNGEAAAHCWNL